jgi:hypothetical protein
MTIWYLHLVLIWYIFSGFGITYHDKSGNPGVEHCAMPTGQVKRFLPISCDVVALQMPS